MEPSKLTEIQKSFVIGVTGGSASGKTTFAKALQKGLGSNSATVLSQDHYYRDCPPEDSNRNFDHPTALDLDLLFDHIRALDRGQNIEIPLYCFKTHRRLLERTAFIRKPIIIIDGTLILHHVGLRERLNSSIFLDVSENLRFERRLARDVKERARSPESVRNQFFTQVKPMHDIFVEPYKSFAQHVIHENDLDGSVLRIAKILFSDKLKENVASH